MLKVMNVARRVLLQYRGDRRFLALSIVAPLLLLTLVKYVFDSLGSVPQLQLANLSTMTLSFVVFIAHFFAYILSGTVLVNERLSGTLERLKSYPIGGAAIVGGYLLGYGIISVLQGSVLIGASQFLFDTSGWGNLWLLFVIALAMSTVSIGLAILISAASRSEAQVFIMIPVIILPSLFLSGIVIPLDMLGGGLEWLSHFVPLRYGMEGVTALMSGDTGGVWLAVGKIAAIAAALLSAGSLTLRRV